MKKGYTRTLTIALLLMLVLPCVSAGVKIMGDVNDPVAKSYLQTRGYEIVSYNLDSISSENPDVLLISRAISTDFGRVSNFAYNGGAVVVSNNVIPDFLDGFGITKAANPLVQLSSSDSDWYMEPAGFISSSRIYKIRVYTFEAGATKNNLYPLSLKTGTFDTVRQYKSIDVMGGITWGKGYVLVYPGASFAWSSSHYAMSGDDIEAFFEEAIAMAYQNSEVSKVTPTPTATETPAPTQTATPTPTQTVISTTPATPSPTATATPSATATATPAATAKKFTISTSSLVYGVISVILIALIVAIVAVALKRGKPPEEKPPEETPPPSPEGELPPPPHWEVSKEGELNKAVGGEGETATGQDVVKED